MKRSASGRGIARRPWGVFNVAVVVQRPLWCTERVQVFGEDYKSRERGERRQGWAARHAAVQTLLCCAERILVKDGLGEKRDAVEVVLRQSHDLVLPDHCLDDAPGGPHDEGQICVRTIRNTRSAQAWQSHKRDSCQDIQILCPNQTPCDPPWGSRWRRPDLP